MSRENEPLAVRIVRFPFARALEAFFRSIEVEGAENVPSEGPLLVLSNHLNAFVDPLMIQHALGRTLTITAKNTLAERPLYGTLMRLGRVVVFHRQSEWGKGADPRATFAAFEECRRRLTAGEALCVFPEGISHDDPSMRIFRVGPAQIAVDFVKRDGDPGGLRILPVGLTYDSKEHFRSRALVRFGPALQVKDWLDAHPGAGRRELTTEIERRVRELVVEHKTHREGIVTAFAARVALAARGEPASLAALTRETRRLRDGLRVGQVKDARRARMLRARILRRRLELRRAGVDPEDVFEAHTRRSALSFLVREGAFFGAGLAPAVAGLVLNAAPALVVWRITRRLSTLRDLWASNAVFASGVAFPAAWVLEGLAASLIGPPASGPALIGAAWLGGRFALRYGDRWRRSRRRARALAHALGRSEYWSAIVEESRSLAHELSSLELEPR